MKPKFGYLYVSFVVSLLILVTLSILLYSQFVNLRRSSDRLDKSYKILFHLEKVRNLTRELESERRGYMVSKDSIFLREEKLTLAVINSTLDSLAIEVAGNHLQTGRIFFLRAALKRKWNVMERNLHLFQKGDTAALYFSVREGKRLMDDFGESIRAIEDFELNESRRENQEKQFYEAIAPNYIVVIFSFAAIITLISFLFILRELKIRLSYQLALEQRVTELNRSTAELEQFTFVASHDLQEPLRKIRTFSDRIRNKYADQINLEGRSSLDRIDQSAMRMQELIQDMVNFTNLIHTSEEAKPVDLNKVFDQALSTYNNSQKGPVPQVYKVQLPHIKGYSTQLNLLFSALIENAIKFAKPGEQPLINVEYAQVVGRELNGWKGNLKESYHKITVEDKGIGFDNEFAEKIFVIFQRLHTQQSAYHGKGIGLAIAQRVVSNHNGFIVAKGVPGEGAKFMLYFPADSTS